MARFVPLVVAGFASLASQDVTELRVDADGPCAAVQAGQAFLVKLPVTPSTGSSWVLRDPAPLVRETAPPHFAVSRPMPGAPGDMVFTLLAQQPGRAALRFVLRTQGPAAANPLTKQLCLDIR